MTSTEDEGSSAPPGAAKRRGFDPVSLATLIAIGVVVLLVSLPSLRGFAQRQNETDAVRLVRILGRAVESAERPPASIREVFEGDPELRRRFRDLEYLEDTDQLRCHGYLFDVSRGVARAWPWDHGRTGFACFVAAEEGLVGHANDASRWSGRDRPPLGPWTPSAGWRPMR
jgi:hypothetical protein